MAPIRELARQIQDVIQSLGSYMGVKVHALIGGTDAKQDQEILRAGGVHVAVGTPGRVLDMINRGSLDLSKVEIIVVDEADQMLDKGFKDQLYEIFTTENSNNNAQVRIRCVESSFSSFLNGSFSFVVGSLLCHSPCRGSPNDRSVHAQPCSYFDPKGTTHSRRY